MRYPRSELYRKHMKSVKWNNIRRKVIALQSNMCFGCGEIGIDDIHHLTYKHLGNEFLFELKGLCRKCHKRLHKG